MEELFPNFAKQDLLNNSLAIIRHDNVVTDAIDSIMKVDSKMREANLQEKLCQKSQLNDFSILISSNVNLK